MVAYGYAQSGAHEFRQVGIEGMEGETRHLGMFACATVGTTRERDVEYLAGANGVLAVGLVEVTATEEQHRIGILRLDIAELFHHRSILSHNILVFSFQYSGF